MAAGRYYSRDAVSALLASLIDLRDGDRVLDLCSGGGALGRALRPSNPGIRLVGVDCSAPPPPGYDIHHLADGLSPGIDTAIGHPPGYDVVLCNPPYGGMPDALHLRGIAEAAGLPHPPARDRSVDAAWTFAAQALRLARPGGLVALILPDGLATGTRAAAFRAALLTRNGLTHAVALPENAFDDTRALAFLLVLRKDGPDDAPVLLSSLGRDGVRGADLPVTRTDAVRRLDHGHHAVMGTAAGPTLGSLGAESVRGRIADEPGARPVAVFSTSSFPAGDGRRAHALPACDGLPSPDALARAGDILIARVHRRLHTKVCLVASGAAAPTDLVLRLRLPPALRVPVADALLSAEGENRLRATARGTGARTLAGADLMAMPLPMAVPFVRGC